ncbi:MAG: putative ribosomal small subunit methyltransferase [Actinomycetota bacterium]|jgi:16S rRNA (guanine527-N7)-methyltransferase
MPVLTPDNRTKLIDALGDAQRIGMLGDRPLDEVVEHSLGFVTALPPQCHTLVDLGSGGGDPGLVIAMARPDLRITLVDRRAKRTDLLVRLVGRLGIRDRVEVLEADVEDLPGRFPGRQWDVVTSRGFGPPDYTARLGAPLLASGGHMLVSEPPDSHGSRWVGVPGLELQGIVAGVSVLIRR